MATNGNESAAQNQAGRGSLSAQLSDLRPGNQPAAADDLDARMNDVVTQLRAISRYTNEWASSLETGVAEYSQTVQRMLGRIGK